MNRSDYFSRDVSKVALPRTLMNMPFQHETAFNTGDIIPLMAEEIYPGDSWKTKVAYLLRLFTPMKQIFSNMYLDLHAFFVPNRLVWTHWVNFLGQNDTDAWTEKGTYTVPFSSWFQSDPAVSTQDLDYLGTMSDYFGINPLYPGNEDTDSMYLASDLFRRGYLLIYNEWYRDENLIAPILFSKGDYPEDSAVFTYSSKPLKAAKFHDYFTTCLPEPMKGTPPTIGEDLPVLPGPEHTGSGVTGVYGLKFRNLINSTTSSNPGAVLIGTNSGSNTASYNPGGLGIGNAVTPTNLWATMAITIEDIRNAAVATHVLEKLASSGSRYPEFLNGIWGVTSSNAELQIPELLGVQRFPISISEVVSNANTVSGVDGEYLGATGAMVKSGNAGHLFNKAFTEYGILYVMGVVRIEQSYFQGLRKKFTRHGFFDYYLPQFQGIGNQPVFKYELVSRQWSDSDYPEDPSAFKDSPILGYQKAFADLAHIPYQVSGIMRPDVLFGLSHWNASEQYSDDVSLNQDFIEQKPDGLDRCIAVPSSTRGSFQWFGEFKFMNTVTRILDPDAQPGLKRI